MTITAISIYFYKILNDDVYLKNLLSGGVYRNQRPKNSETSDIVIITRYLNGTNIQNVQNGETQIVIILPKISGVPDLSLQNRIEKRVIEILNNSKNFQNINGFYFELETTTEHDNYDGQFLFSSLYLTFKIHKP